MTEANSRLNRFVWVDIPVDDLDRASAFYESVLGAKCELESFEGFSYAVISHEGGNGGCLVPRPEGVGPDGMGSGPLVYLNVDGRIREASAKVESLGGTVLQEVHEIGAYGFRAMIIDTEGNRLALHSATDS